MKKVIIVAVTLALCFALTAYAADVFTVGVDSINTTAGENGTVVYTPAYGNTVGNLPNDYYIITVVPRITGSDVSEDAEGGISSDVSESVSNESLPELPSEGSSEGALSSEGTFPIVSEGGSAAETVAKYRESDYKFKVAKVYAPGTATENVEIPANGFVLIFPASTEGMNSSTGEESILGRNVTAADIEAGAPVAVFGVDFETNVLSSGAYVEIDLTGKGLMGDVPQTSDNGAVITFTVTALLATAGAAYVYRKRA